MKKVAQLQTKRTTVSCSPRGPHNSKVAWADRRNVAWPFLVFGRKDRAFQVEMRPAVSLVCQIMPTFASLFNQAMGNFIKQQEVRKEVKEKEKLSRETLGKFFYDLAKITFTALVVGSIVSVATEQEERIYWWLIVIGVLVTYVFTHIGYKLIRS